MMSYCRKSCGICQVCTDDYYCKRYSFHRRCRTSYMKTACSVSCRTCGRSTNFDKHQQCNGWAERGECKRRPTYMKTYCACSCAKINGGGKKKVDGGYTNWSKWSKCSVACGDGVQYRTRSCTNPKPANGGKKCFGNSKETKSCKGTFCPVDGGFTPWSQWGECSVTCGDGIKHRTRSCTNPKPQHGGKKCLGNSRETDRCQKEACTGVITSPPQPPTEKPIISTKINENICGKRTTSDAKNSLFKRIVNGEDADLKDWPWIANMRRKSNPRHLCGASILNENFILTAAHCLGYGKPDASDYQMRLGESHIGQKEIEATERTFDIESITVHPKYDAVTYDHDIALFKVKGKIEYNHVTKPICIPNQGQEFDPKSKCFLAGWGHGEEDGQRILKLQEVEMPLINHDVCEKAFPDSHDEVTVNMICAGHKSGEFDACQGDSGGPLICDVGGTWQEAGIVSWGEGCGREGKYGVFTKVSNYRKWIEETLKKEAA